MEGSILESLKKHWYLVLAIVGFLVWFTDKVVEASNTLSDVHELVHINKSQSESFQDIKLQLNILQQDIKEISKN